MDNEEMVQIVTKEILRQLQQNPVITEGQSLPALHKALVIFTGGTIGFEQGLAEIKKLQGLCSTVTVVLSAAAEQILGIERITEALGSHIDIVTAQSPYPGKTLREVDIMIIPVLTQNTAAKVAHTFSDTMVSTLILQGLMMGKPIVAAYNAADPLDSWRMQYAMGNSSSGLIKALQENLQKLAGFGMELIPVDNIATVSRKRLCREKQMTVKQTMEQAVSKPDHKKAVLDAAAIQTAAQSGTKSIMVPRGTILTPLARDVAREYGVELVQG